MSRSNVTNSLLRGFELISSLACLLVLCGGWIFCYVIYSIWSKEVFASFVTELERNNFFAVAPFVLFLLTGWLNLFRVSVNKAGQGLWSLFSRLCLPFGALFFCTGLLISLTTRHFEWIIAGEGHSIKPAWSSENFMISKIEAGVESSKADLKSIGLFKYAPKAEIMGGDGKTYTIGAFPASKVGSYYAHILNFGLAPGFVIAEPDGTKNEGYMPLKMFTPGSGDSFNIEPYPYKFVVQIEPSSTPEAQNQSPNDSRLKPPVFSVKIFKSEQIIAEGNSRQTIEFDGMRLGFLEPTLWVQVEIAEDRGFLLIILGILFIIIGIPLAAARLLISIQRSHDKV